MATYYNSSGGGNRNNSGDWWSWLPIIILFCIPSPFTWIVAFFMLVSKLKGGVKGSKNVKRHPYDLQKDAENWEQVSWEEQNKAQRTKTTQQQAARGTDQRAADNGRAYSGRKASKVTDRKAQAARKAKHSGAASIPLIIAGAAVAGVFGLGFIAVLSEALMYGSLAYNLSGLIACFLFMAGGFISLGSGVDKRRRAERYMNYLAYIGANREVPLAHMSAAFDVSVRKLCKDLRDMLSKGILPTGYLDLAEGKLFLTEMGYRAPEPKKEEPEKEAVRTKEDDDAILREIRQINDDIPGEEMSTKIDRIEEITGKILKYQKEHPNREGQLRSFLSYYLPTTLKILRAYAQLDAQGIEGENISAAKARIEGMMDQVVAGFEKQLDKLFQDDALDITSDVAVLENMLKKDGLSDGQGMTLGM